MPSLLRALLVHLLLLTLVDVADAAKKKKSQKKAGHDVAADQQWLEEKSKEEGVVTTDSGLRYKVLKSGKPWAKSPLPDTKCTCKYAGTLTPANGGKQFDSGEIDFAPNQVIKGWTEAMQLMKEGDEVRAVAAPGTFCASHVRCSVPSRYQCPRPAPELHSHVRPWNASSASLCSGSSTYRLSWATARKGQAPTSLAALLWCSRWRSRRYTAKKRAVTSSASSSSPRSIGRRRRHQAMRQPSQRRSYERGGCHALASDAAASEGHARPPETRLPGRRGQALQYTISRALREGCSTAVIYIGGHSWSRGDKVCICRSRKKGCISHGVSHAIIHPWTSVKSGVQTILCKVPQVPGVNHSKS